MVLTVTKAHRGFIFHTRHGIAVYGNRQDDILTVTRIQGSSAGPDHRVVARTGRGGPGRPIGARHIGQTRRQGVCYRDRTELIIRPEIGDFQREFVILPNGKIAFMTFVDRQIRTGGGRFLKGTGTGGGDFPLGAFSGLHCGRPVTGTTAARHGIGQFIGFGRCPGIIGQGHGGIGQGHQTFRIHQAEGCAGNIVAPERVADHRTGVECLPGRGIQQLGPAGVGRVVKLDAVDINHILGSQLHP